MKIDLQSKLNYYTAPVADLKNRQAKETTPQKASSNFDGITIQANQAPSREEQFVSSLTSRVSMEIRKPVSQSRIEELQQQIDTGQYQVDVNAVADKIMLY